MLEEIGRNLTPSPFLTTAVAAVRALEGSAQAERWFPGIVAGETVAALAIDEGQRSTIPAGSRWKPSAQDNGFSLNGTKQFVVQGASADVILVAARTGGSAGETDGLTLFAVAHGHAGADDRQCRAGQFVQGGAADLRSMSRSMPTRWSARSMAAGRRCRARSTPAGPARRANWSGSPRARAEMTFDYLKQRKQFGKLIGEYQALQHRAAHLYGEIEIARAAALKAAQLLDAGDARAELMVVGRQGQGGKHGGARRPGGRPDARRHRHDRRA